MLVRITALVPTVSMVGVFGPFTHAHVPVLPSLPVSVVVVMLQAFSVAVTAAGAVTKIFIVSVSLQVGLEKAVQVST